VQEDFKDLGGDTLGKLRGGRARARGWVHASIGNPVEPALQLFVKHDPNFPAV
jgi:hypothetical protein